MDENIQTLIKTFPQNVQDNLEHWLKDPVDKKTQDQIIQLIQSHPKEIENAFFSKLSFGTAGARGIMGIGSNRLNIFTIQSMTQGLANYLNTFETKDQIKVLIGFDNRNFSKEFALETAKVLAGNGIFVYLFKNLRPTPLVSFGALYLGCKAAVMITASHNPPKYNGYKVYWEDGGQVLPPHDIEIIKHVNQIQDFSQIKIADEKSKNIRFLFEEVDEAYYKEISTMQHFPKKTEESGSNLKLIYTNLHGTGITLMPKALSNWGFLNVKYVEKQKPTLGDFPFAPLPNPEEKEALHLGIELLKKEEADLFIATDPDADRVAIVVNHHGEIITLSGNQIACILLYHQLKSYEEKKQKLPPNSVCVKSIVTTELLKEMCKASDVECIDVLTGFKYIAEKIKSFEKEGQYFLLGAEESYGYLCNTFVRDKDAISTSCLLAERALLAKEENKSLVDILHEIYRKHGLFLEKTISIGFEETEEGLNKMKSLMENLRKNPPKVIGNYQVAIFDDFLERVSINLENQQKSNIDLPSSDVLRFWLTDHSKIVIRPSGTEPKIKLYVAIVEENVEQNIQETINQCENRLEALTQIVKDEFFS